MARVTRRHQREYDEANKGKTPNYRNAKEALQKDFQGRCAFCMIHESQMANFHIDHFYPRDREGTDRYTNLYWVCASCNLAKSGTFPKGLTELDLDRIVNEPDRLRFADPCREQDYGNHFVEDKNGNLDACTLCGRYHIKHLRLNRQYLVNYRREREKRKQTLAELKDLITQLNAQRSSAQRSSAQLDKDTLRMLLQYQRETEESLQSAIPFFECLRRAQSLPSPATCKGICNP